MTPPSFTCPLCARTSWDPRDAAEGYCGFCSDWTGTDVVAFTCPSCGAVAEPPAPLCPVACASGHEPVLMRPRYAEEARHWPLFACPSCAASHEVPPGLPGPPRQVLCRHCDAPMLPAGAAARLQRQEDRGGLSRGLWQRLGPTPGYEPPARPGLTAGERVAAAARYLRRLAGVISPDPGNSLIRGTDSAGGPPEPGGDGGIPWSDAMNWSSGDETGGKDI